MKKNLLICLLTWVMCMPAFAQETFTVFDGTTEGTGTSTALKTNDFVPACIKFWNKPSKSQFIIPAEFLTQMKGGYISSVKFYAISSNTPYTSASTADVYVNEVDYITFNANIGHFDFEPKANCTIVYQGAVTVERVGPTNEEWGEMTITFNTPYQYRGGNLLIGFENTTNVEWKRFLFKGQAAMWHAGLAGYQMTETYYYKQQCDFIPKTTFTYTPGTLPGIIGDVNCDGAVTSVDITCLYNYLLNSDMTFYSTSDVDGDGAITSADITVIYNILLGNEE